VDAGVRIMDPQNHLNGTSPSFPNVFTLAAMGQEAAGVGGSQGSLSLLEHQLDEDAHMDSPDPVRQSFSAPQLQQLATPTWDAASLLNPKHATGPVPAPTSPGRPANTGRRAEPQRKLTFEFSSAANDFNVTPEQPVSRNVGEAYGTTGMGSMLERNFNVQDRTLVPQVKRRKIETSDDASDDKHKFGAGGSGILSSHLKGREGENGAGSSGKTSDTVDLTEGMVPHLRGATAEASMLTVTGGEDDLMIIEQPKEEEVCFGMLENAHVNCHKVPAPKPNMQALGGPAFWPLVKIVLRRKVGDSTNLIQVYDHTREVFGYIDNNTAGGLAPLLDIPNLRLRTEARIPTRRKIEGENAGQPVSRAYKIELTLYGPFKYAKAVGAKLAQSRIFLVKPLRVEPGVRLVFPTLARPPVAETSYSRASAAEHSTPSIMPMGSRTVEEIRSEVLGVFDNMTKSEELPELEADDRIETELLPHQKQALYFMTRREMPVAEQDDQKLASIWQKKTSKSNQTVYYNVITGHHERNQPAETLGGILADMMGLGKTLSVLSLVSVTMEEAGKWALLEPKQPMAPENKKPSSSTQILAARHPQLELTRLLRNGKGTLLVCPLSTITNWEEQIKQHVKEDSLTYHIYHGQNRIKDAEQLSQFDLVITTYGSVASELTSRHRRKDGRYPLEEIGWFRVVLDEAHMIREPSTLQFKAICRLQANRRWAVTGTPVQNRLDDLGSLLAFLRLKPFDNRAKFLEHIVNRFKMCDPEILPKLRILVDTITLRRKKDRINLPERKEHLVRLDFSADERRLYDVFATMAKEKVTVLTGQRDRMLGGKTYIHILQSILRLRLICAHGKDLLTEEDLQMIEGISADSAINIDSDDEEDKPALSEEKAYQMFDLMMETDNDACISCKQKLGSNDEDNMESEKQEDLLGYMTPCFHLYCPRCIRSFKDNETGASYKSNAVGRCPICSQRIKFSCVELRHARADAVHEAHGNAKAMAAKGKVVRIEGYTGPHTKTQALVKELVAHRNASEAKPDQPPIKSVVFSGWTAHLDLIELALAENGLKYCRLDGKMTRAARTASMDLFRDDPSVPIILVSIMAGGLGLNLTTGNNVYVMEPQYNPAAEAQAVDRVHRLGQKRPVRVVKFIMRDSFEESMLELQNKKIKLANLSMDRTKQLDKAESARQRLEDLKTLFK
jgi:SNF2 family DNA or RNA helicase